jgi:branched-chain amino acid aminotransferase
MINYNGEIVNQDHNSLQSNRAFLYGDAVFETLKIVNNRILFLEDHYFRLMASMRILRMEIPMNFTQEFIEKQVLDLATANHIGESARVRITVYRNSEGYYLPETNIISYLISVKPLDNQLYKIENNTYEVDLFKDFYISKQLLSTLKTTNKLINITGSIYAKENDLNNCLLLNEDKNVVEALNGNIFVLMGNKLTTPLLSDGCLNGILRKQIIEILKNMEDIEFYEQTISPFDLQKADELFITNTITGIQPITKYRKKEYRTSLSNELLIKLNQLIGF